MKTNEPRDLAIAGTTTILFCCGWSFSLYYNHKSVYDIRVFNDTSIAVEVDELGGPCDGKVLPGKYLEADCGIYNPNSATLELRIASWGEDYELDLYHVVRAYQKLPDKTKPVIVNVSEIVLRGRRSEVSKNPEKADLQRKLRRMEEVAPSRFSKQRN